MIVIKSYEFMGKLYRYLKNQKNQGVYVIKFLTAGGSKYFSLPTDQRRWTNENLENERHYAKDRCITGEIKASFHNSINLDGLAAFISENIDTNKLSSCMADFGIPAETEINKDKFAKSLAIQFCRFVISSEIDISNEIWQIYQSLLNGEDINFKDVMGPRYTGDEVAVFSKNRIESNCYEHLRHQWEIQNRGRVEWYGRKLVLLNQEKMGPKIADPVLLIPDMKPNDIIKITTEINSGGNEGNFEIKWEMQDANGDNCFPNCNWHFNIKIHVTFMG